VPKRTVTLELPDPLTHNQRWLVPVPSKNLALELPGRALNAEIAALNLPDPYPHIVWPVPVPSKNLALELPGRAHC